METKLTVGSMATDYIPATQITIILVEEAAQYITGRGGEKIVAIFTEIDLDPVSNELEGKASVIRWTDKDPDVCFILISADLTDWYLPSVHPEKVFFLTKPLNIDDLFAAARTVLQVN